MEVRVDRVQCVVASVYIPPGEIQKVQVFSEQLAKVCHAYEEVLVAMDFNARHKYWDAEVSGSGTNKKMGDMLMEVIIIITSLLRVDRMQPNNKCK